MRSDMEAMATIMAAQGAGGNGNAVIYSTAAPGMVAAEFIVGVIILVAILIGIIDHFFEEE